MNLQPRSAPLSAPSAPSAPAATTAQRDLPTLLLGAVAIALCTLLLVQIGRGPAGTPAIADLVSNNADATLLAADAGNSEDVVLILDQRAEALLLYRCANQRTVDFKGRTDLRQLFFEARKSGK